jgi:hypothetical protein
VGTGFRPNSPAFRFHTFVADRLAGTDLVSTAGLAGWVSPAD